MVTDEILVEGIDDVIKKIPRPTEIPFLLEATGVIFDESMMNDLEAAGFYTTNLKSALNLGIYITDIGMLTAYGRPQLALDYLHQTMGLADHLGIVTAYDVALTRKFEENIRDRDSLASILNIEMKKTHQYLRAAYRTKTAVLVLTGGFIEGLYMSTHIINQYHRNASLDLKNRKILSQLIRLVVKQQESLQDIIYLLEVLDTEDDVSQLRVELQKLNSNFEQIDHIESITEHMVDSILASQNFNELTERMFNIRTKIISRADRLDW